MKTNQEALDFGIGNKEYRATKDLSEGFSSVWVGTGAPYLGAVGSCRKASAHTQLCHYSVDMRTKVCHLHMEYGS